MIVMGEINKFINRENGKFWRAKERRGLWAQLDLLCFGVP